MYAEFKQRASFLTIYVSEAHAVDEWPVGDHYNGIRVRVWGYGYDFSPCLVLSDLYTFGVCATWCY